MEASLFQLGLDHHGNNIDARGEDASRMEEEEGELSEQFEEELEDVAGDSEEDSDWVDSEGEEPEAPGNDGDQTQRLLHNAKVVNQANKCRHSKMERTVYLRDSLNYLL